MRQASSFTPLAPTLDAPTTATWRGSLVGALDGAAFTIPLSLGAVTLVFSKIGGDMMPAAILTTLLAIAILQVATANARRPLLFSARFFEATTLAAMMDRAIELLPSWSLADTQGMRVALLCTLVGGAGLFTGVLYALRADRFSRHIPTPVFAAFSDSIAVVLIVSQAGTLKKLLSGDGASVALLLALGAFAVGVGVRRWLPRWPAAACALATGLALGAILYVLGSPPIMLGSARLAWTVPAASADFRGLFAGLAHAVRADAWIAANAAILGGMMFINTSIAAQAMSHIDDKPRESGARLAWTSVWLSIAGFFGAAPLSASLQATTAAARQAPFAPRLLTMFALATALVAASGVLALVPVAAVAGALVCEAIFMVDRPSLKLARRWSTRERLSRQQREDLALVAVVTGTAILFNMVAGVIAGLLLGLLLFASRHVTPPVRASWDGTQMSSNCARSRADVHMLARTGRDIRVFELQGDLFFGTVDALDRALRDALQGARCIVLDWSRVRHVDTSALQACAKFERAAREAQVAIVHVDPATASPQLAADLAATLSGHEVAPDLDRALERAENHVLRQHGAGGAAGDDTASIMESMSLLRGLADDERAALDAAMIIRTVAAGQYVVRAGEPGDELMVVLHGSASVLVADGMGSTMRVAGLRRGALIGEVAFLDSAPRSATVIAHEDMLLAVLTRREFDSLSQRMPRLVQQLLSNIAVYLATRLRRTTAMAAARQAHRG